MSLSFLAVCRSSLVLVFVLVSRASETDVEGFGLVYLEAAAAGVPSLGSRAGGATDAIADGQSGFIVDGTSQVLVIRIVSNARCRRIRGLMLGNMRIR